MTSRASRRGRQHRRVWNDSLIDQVLTDELQLFPRRAAVLPTPALSLRLGLLGLVSCLLMELRQWSSNSPQFHKRGQQLGQDMEGNFKLEVHTPHQVWALIWSQWGASILSASLHHLSCFWIKQHRNWKEIVLTDTKFSITISLERRK